MKIAAYQAFSLIDYPGHPCATIFTQGCNFRCPWCHNKELISQRGSEAISHERVFAKLRKQKNLVRALTVCGGEPTQHPALPNFLAIVKSMGFIIKLDTNGSRPDVLRKLLTPSKGPPLVDYVAVDYKAPAKEYSAMCGSAAKGEDVLQSIRLLKKTGIAYHIRTTKEPRLDSERLNRMKEELGGLERWVLQDYREVP